MEQHALVATIVNVFPVQVDITSVTELAWIVTLFLEANVAIAMPASACLVFQDIVSQMDLASLAQPSMEIHVQVVMPARACLVYLILFSPQVFAWTVHIYLDRSV